MSWGELFRPEVFDRGAKVYFEGGVTDLEVFPDHITAKVGREEVSVTKVDGEIAEGQCSCKNNWCEHIAAVLFAAEDTDRESGERSIESILEGVSAEGLRSFVLSLSGDPAVEAEIRAWFDDDYESAGYEEILEDIFNDLPIVGDVEDEDVKEIGDKLTDFFRQHISEYADQGLYDDLADLLIVTASNLDAFNGDGKFTGLFRSLFQMTLDCCLRLGDACLRAFVISLIRVTRYDSLFSFEPVLDSFFLGPAKSLIPADYLIAYYDKRGEEADDPASFDKARAEVLASIGNVLG